MPSCFEGNILLPFAGPCPSHLDDVMSSAIGRLMKKRELVRRADVDAQSTSSLAPCWRICRSYPRGAHREVILRSGAASSGSFEVRAEIAAYGAARRQVRGGGYGFGCDRGDVAGCCDNVAGGCRCGAVIGC